jgi:hypothetical protein
MLLWCLYAGLQEFARYYGFYAGADKAGQGAMAFGSNATNLQHFKDRFRWAGLHWRCSWSTRYFSTARIKLCADAQPSNTCAAFVKLYNCTVCAGIDGFTAQLT